MSDFEPDAIDVRRRRLLFRATHRGTHENDLMIGGFVRTHLTEFGDSDLDALESLLEYPETALADWLTGRQPLPDDAAPMLRRMRDAVAGGLHPIPLREGVGGRGASRPDLHVDAPIPPTFSHNGSRERWS